MIMTDPIADMLTRVRNAIQARHTEVEIPASKEKLEIAKILKEEGYILGYETEGDVKKTITLTLKYGPNKEKVISGLKRKLNSFRLKNKIVRLKPYKSKIYKSSKFKKIIKSNTGDAYNFIINSEQSIANFTLAAILVFSAFGCVIAGYLHGIYESMKKVDSEEKEAVSKESEEASNA